MDSRVAAVHDAYIYARTEQGVNKGEKAVTEAGSGMLFMMAFTLNRHNFHNK